MTKFQFVEKTHSYIYSDALGLKHEVPSATRCLDHAGLTDYDSVRADILERKSAIGKAAHDATHYFDQNDLDFSTLSDMLKGYVESWATFSAKMSFVPLAIEDQSIAFINEMPYGMKLDRFGTIRGGVDTVVELKTTRTLEDHHGIQLAFYACGYLKPDESRTSTAFSRFATRQRIAVQLNPNGKMPKMREFTERKDYDVALAALQITHWKLSQRKKLPEITDDGSAAAGAAT